MLRFFLLVVFSCLLWEIPYDEIKFSLFFFYQVTKQKSCTLSNSLIVDFNFFKWFYTHFCQAGELRTHRFVALQECFSATQCSTPFWPFRMVALEFLWRHDPMHMYTEPFHIQCFITIIIMIIIIVIIIIIIIIINNSIEVFLHGNIVSVILAKN